MLAVATAAGLAGALAVPTRAAGSPVTITWWSWSHDAELENVKKYVAQFEKANPDIKVNLVYVNWTDIPKKLPIAVAGGSAPDVANVDPYWAYDLADAGVYYDLTELVQRDLKADPAYDIADIFPGALQMFQTMAGRQFGWPDNLDIQGFFYNTDLYDAAGLVSPNDQPWNWQTMLEDAIKLTRDTNNDNKPEQYGFSEWYFDWYQLVLANGSQIITSELKNALHSSAARQAMEYWYRFNQAKVIAPYVTGQPNPAQMFNQGKVGIQPCGYYLSLTLNKLERPIGYDVTNHPLSPIGKRAATAGGGGYIIPKTSKHVEEAWRLIKFLTSKETLAQVLQQPGAMPLRRSQVGMAFSATFPPKHKAVFGQILGYTVSSPQVPHWSTVREKIIGDMGKYFSGQVSMDQALDQLDKDLAVIYRDRAKK